MTANPLSTASEQVSRFLEHLGDVPKAGPQALLILAALFLAFGLTMALKQLVLPRLRRHWGEESLKFVILEREAGCLPPLVTALVLEGVIAIAYVELPSHHLLVIAAKIAWAWLFVRFFTAFVVKKKVSRLLTLLIYSFMILEIFGVLAPFSRFLDSFFFRVQDVKISLLNILQGTLIALILILLSNFILTFLENNLPTRSHLSPRQQILMLKVAKMVSYLVITIIVLDTIGLDFYLISIFSGAFGLGLGFGLQRVVANIFAGFVILMDKSIRPGDVLETDGVFGFVQSLHGRHIALTTRDGKSHLIPNEHLISEKIINWSFGHPNVRLKISVGISYSSDLHLAMELMEQAARQHPRVLPNPQPVTRLLSFGDSAINLQVRFWIQDPQNGVTNICSDIQLAIWEAFLAHGITIPFPQREVHLYEKEGGAAASSPPDGQ